MVLASVGGFWGVMGGFGFLGRWGGVLVVVVGLVVFWRWGGCTGVLSKTNGIAIRQSQSHGINPPNPINLNQFE